MNNNFIEYESNGNRNKTLSIKEFLGEIKPYLKYIINTLKKSDTWKNQLTTVINFISSKDICQKRIIHPKCGNMEIITYDKEMKFPDNFLNQFLIDIRLGCKHQ